MKVNILDFIQTGKFDFIKLGDAKEYLLHNFHVPDDWQSGKTIENANIWRFGNIEFHFSTNELVMICCDYINCIYGGDDIELDKWIFEDNAFLTLEDVMCELKRKKIDFTVKRDHDIGFAEITMLQSNVRFIFTDYDENIVDSNCYLISSFYLK